MTPEERAARTAARMEHLKQVLTPEEWAQVVGSTPPEEEWGLCTCGGTWPCAGAAWMGDHSLLAGED